MAERHFAAALLAFPSCGLLVLLKLLYDRLQRGLVNPAKLGQDSAGPEDPVQPPPLDLTDNNSFFWAVPGSPFAVSSLGCSFVAKSADYAILWALDKQGSLGELP
jgi:hypothetical protein